jgi:hypothetical protein
VWPTKIHWPVLFLAVSFSKKLNWAVGRDFSLRTSCLVAFMTEAQIPGLRIQAWGWKFQALGKKFQALGWMFQASG